MMDIIKVLLFVVLNLILYTSFGMLFLKRKNKDLSLSLSLVVGFFCYYALFFFVCFPFMKKYRPLSWLSYTWISIAIVVVILSLIICRKQVKSTVGHIILAVKAHPLAACIITTIVLIQVILVTVTYNFTLDAAFYVSNVGTCVNTNMINVYDPFTGAWQDHFELRYFFATYSVNDAVMCQLLKADALIWTKSVMSATVIIIVNVLYYKISRFLFENNVKAITIMMGAILLVNLTFISMYTSSLFLLTRTYEGKTVIGNLAIPLLFYIYMHLSSDKDIDSPWLIMFITAVGAVTISSSANMLIPGALCVMFVPYMIMKRTAKPLLKLIACVIPGLVMTAVYILYIEGYFVFYTYPEIFR